MPHVPHPDAFAHLSAHLRILDGTGPAIPGDDGAVAVLTLEGELDRWTVMSPEWAMALVQVTSAGAVEAGEVLVLDLRRLYFLDLTGLAELEDLAVLLATGGRRLAWSGTRPRIREFLRQAGADLGEEYPSAEIDQQHVAA
ncbi:STAS domain-containing protein [Actinospica durhamensis]|uniref:STAS domain-containing protein n=1 Tax=Actinospica durhamensis TaxID=1508375 RepID=A0A941IQE2_9ACTN|nr:STAS domain-containing protein [Actinospica durhamensis]MBR7837555.1 STAS domain-containing protein [Actinospica durhamensis]